MLRGRLFEVRRVWVREEAELPRGVQREGVLLHHSHPHRGQAVCAIPATVRYLDEWFKDLTFLCRVCILRMIQKDISWKIWDLQVILNSAVYSQCMQERLGVATSRQRKKGRVAYPMPTERTFSAIGILNAVVFANLKSSIARSSIPSEGRPGRPNRPGFLYKATVIWKGAHQILGQSD